MIFKEIASRGEIFFLHEGELLAAQEEETADIRSARHHDSPLLIFWRIGVPAQHHG
jgi:hypothetical protein